MLGRLLKLHNKNECIIQTLFCKNACITRTRCVKNKTKNVKNLANLGFWKEVCDNSVESLKNFIFDFVQKEESG